MKHLPQWPKVLYCYPNWANKPWMPSNGTEGMEFMGEWCSNCMYEHPIPEQDPRCKIITQAMCEGQPDEWAISNEGWPVCTKFKKWDWGSNDDDEGYNEPPPPDPFNPRQLQMPFDLIGVLVGYDDFLVMPAAVVERDLVCTN